MEIKDLSQIELKVLSDALSGIIYQQPQLLNLKKMHEEVQVLRKSGEYYNKSIELLNKAIDNGLDDGYAEPEDFYFSLYEGNIVNTGKRYVALLLCLKFKWFQNGEAYNPREDNMRPRNFGEFIPDSLEEDEFDPDDITQDISTVRQWLLDAGYEEKTELNKYYEIFLKEFHKLRFG